MVIFDMWAKEQPGIDPDKSNAPKDEADGIKCRQDILVFMDMAE